MALLGIACVLVVLCWKSFPLRQREPTIGMEGRVRVVLAHASFQSVPYTHGDPRAVRVASVRKTREGDEGFLYDIRYQLYSPGEHDLRSSLIDDHGAHPDQPLLVSVDPLLAADESGELFDYRRTRMEMGSSYLLVMRGLTLLWACALLPLIFYGRTSAKPTAAPSPAPTCTERVRELLKVAKDSPLDAKQRAELEVLLLECWARRYGVTSQRMASISEAIRSGECGPLLRDLERWIHSPHSGAAKMSPVLLDSLAKSCEAEP